MVFANIPSSWFPRLCCAAWGAAWGVAAVACCVSPGQAQQAPTRLPVAQWPSAAAEAAYLFDHPPLNYDDTEYLNPGYISNSPGLTPGNTSLLDPYGNEPAALQMANEHQNAAAAWLVEDVLEGGKLSDHKDGFFQKLSFSATWLNRGGLLDYGQTELELYATFAVPLPTREWPLLISPLFEVQYLDGPSTPDLPPRLYETYVDFMWVPRLNRYWTGILALTPSVYSDFESSDGAFRWTGKGLVRYDWSPSLQFLAGVLYLNRDDVRILGAGGLIWTPNDDTRYEVLFPRPKLAHRILIGDCFEDWIYLAGEFGGNTFAIRRASGIADRLTLRDLRFMIGLERKREGGAGRRLEIGYVFAREAEYASGTPSIEPNNTVLLRGAVSY